MLRRSVFHMCQCVSMSPGSTIMPRPSMTLAFAALSPLPMATISPLRICRSPPAMVALSMVITWALRIRYSPRAGSFLFCWPKAGAMIGSVPRAAAARRNARRERRCMIMGSLLLQAIISAMSIKLQSVELRVADVEGVARFFADVWGLTRVPEAGGGKLRGTAGLPHLLGPEGGQPPVRQHHLFRPRGENRE